jgi:hypothetical protein
MGDDFMNRAMEDMISRDLGLGIEKIRTSSWDELEKMPRKKEKAFRPKDMFFIGGNINLSENREMGTAVLELRNTYRKVTYKTKCLLKDKKNESTHYTQNIKKKLSR